MVAINFYIHFKLLSIVSRTFTISPATPPYAVYTPVRHLGLARSVRSPRLCSRDFLSRECCLPVDCLEDAYSSFKAESIIFFPSRHSAPTQTKLLCLVPLFGLCIHPSKQQSTSLHIIVYKSSFPSPDTSLKRPVNNILFPNQVLSLLQLPDSAINNV